LFILIFPAQLFLALVCLMKFVSPGSCLPAVVPVILYLGGGRGYRGAGPANLLFLAR
jgi:hypothetical protein